MAKIPDFSKITGKLGKLDFQEIVSSVKSIINPGSVIPKQLEDDPTVGKIAMVLAALQNLQQLQEQQQQEIAKAQNVLAGLLKDLAAQQAAKVVEVKSDESNPAENPTEKK